jgi:hypothetical protein
LKNAFHWKRLVYTPVRFNKQSATANLYDILMVSRRSFSSTNDKFNSEYVKIKLQEYIYEFNIDLYILLKVSRESTMEEIEKAYKDKAKFYDPKITGKND